MSKEKKECNGQSSGMSFLDSYFIGGFKYDGKAVFGVIETSERMETVRKKIINLIE